MNINPSLLVKISAAVLTGLLLFFVLTLHLLVSLLAGLFVYHLIHALTPLLKKRFADERARFIVATFLATLLIVLLTFSVIGTIGFFRDGNGQPQALFDKAMLVIEEARTQLPHWIADYLPVDAQTLRQDFVEWINDHAKDVQFVGKEAARFIVHILVGMIFGGIIAVSGVRSGIEMKPFAAELAGYSRRFANAFRNIVLAQVKISLVNTTFTAIFLFGVLPIAGVKMPLAKTLILITFIAGLLPVIGNLISNTVITMVALSVSVYVAIAALAFLVIIHKLEYFLNARIVGSQINSRTWELLLSMILLEAAFGIPGLVAAPLYYAYVKSELQRVGWV